MTKTKQPKAHIVQHANGFHYLIAMNRADALAQFAVLFPGIKAKDAWKSCIYTRRIPVDGLPTSVV